MRDIKYTFFLIAVCLLTVFGAQYAAFGATSSRIALSRVAIYHGDADEPPSTQAARLDDVSAAIDGATPLREERAWLLMTGERESNYARYVGYDWEDCRLGKGGRCDAGRAYGFWQLHGTDRNLDWATQAKQSIVLFRQKANWCAARGFDYWEGGTAAYATGRCEWKNAASRVRRMREMLGWL